MKQKSKIVNVAWWGRRWQREWEEKEMKIRTRITDTMIAASLFLKAVHGASYHSSLLYILLTLIGRIPTVHLLFIFCISYIYLADRIAVFITAGCWILSVSQNWNLNRYSWWTSHLRKMLSVSNNLANVVLVQWISVHFECHITTSCLVCTTCIQYHN